MMDSFIPFECRIEKQKIMVSPRMQGLGREGAIIMGRSH